MRAMTACIPAKGSQAPRTNTGGPSANPVNQDMPVRHSMVWAKPVRSRHGPSRPKAGIRTMMSWSFSPWTRSQSKPNCSMTRGVKFSTKTSAVCRRRSNISDPSGRDRSNVTPRFPALAAWKIGTPLPPAVMCRWPGTGEAHVVRSRHRFNLDDVCSQSGQGSGGHRTGPPGGAVDDTNVGQREPPVLRRAASPSASAVRPARVATSVRLGQSIEPPCWPIPGAGANGRGDTPEMR